MINQKQLDAFKIHCKIHAKGLADDLFQHVILIVLESNYKEDNFLPLLKRIAFYQFYNKRSDFNKAYRPKEIDKELYLIALQEEELEERIKREELEDRRINKLKKVLNTYPTCKRELFKKEVFLEAQRLGSYSKLSKKCDIPKQTLIKAGKKYAESLRNNHF